MTDRYDPDWVRQHYTHAGEKEWHRLTERPTGEVKLHVHCHYLQQHIRRNDEVLEVGPGPGRFTKTLAELGARVVAVDISPAQLDLHRRYAAEQGFDHAVLDRLELDVCDMKPLDDGRFDAAVCYGGPLSYVFDRRGEALAELLRVLRPRGTLLVSVMSLWGVVHEYLAGVLPLAPEINDTVIRSGDLCPETYPDSTHHCHMFTAAELRSFLEDAGAEILALSASNCLSAVWGDRLDEARSNPVQWRQLLDMEIQACRQPGCLDMGTHLIAVARKP